MTKLTQAGVAHIFLLLAAVGIIGFILVSSSANFKTKVFSLLFPKPPSQAAVGGFFEKFDDNPAGLPIKLWKSNRFDQVQLQQAGRLENGFDTHIIEAGHGAGCQPPIGNADPSLNIHNINVDNDPALFRQNVAPQIYYLCNNHMMTVLKTGGPVVSFMPRYVFDWTGRTGHLQIDNNIYAFGREWWAIYIVPKDEMIMNIQHPNEGGSGELFPRRAILFSNTGGSPRVELIDNYRSVYVAGSQALSSAFGNDPAFTDPRTRRTFRFEVSQTSWAFEIQRQDGSFYRRTGNWPQPLSFNSGLVKVEHEAYNPTKDGIFGTPWSQFTYHWDNFYFDGPAEPAFTAFEADQPFMRVPVNGTPTPISSMTINVPSSDLRNPVLQGQVLRPHLDNDPANAGGWFQFRINGGSWQNASFVKPISIGIDRGESTFRSSVAGQIHQGVNTVEFRQPTSLAGDNSAANITDVRFQVDPIAGLTPAGNPTGELPPNFAGPSDEGSGPSAPPATSTPAPAATPRPSTAPTPSPTARPSSSPVPVGGFSCTIVLGFSQTAEWFSAAENIMGNDRTEIFAVLGAGLDGWNTYFRGLPTLNTTQLAAANPPFYYDTDHNSGCTQNRQTPDRIIFTITSSEYNTNVENWKSQLRTAIQRFRTYTPSARQIVLQPLVGGPNHTTQCPSSSAPQFGIVRATYNHPYIWTAIQQLVPEYNGFIVAGADPHVNSCSDYIDGVGHLRTGSYTTIGQTIGNYYLSH